MMYVRLPVHLPLKLDMQGFEEHSRSGSRLYTAKGTASTWSLGLENEEGDEVETRRI